jgi:hypothetical protein
LYEVSTVEDELQTAVAAMKRELDELCQHVSERDGEAPLLPVAEALTGLDKLRAKLKKLTANVRGK